MRLHTYIHTWGTCCRLQFFGPFSCSAPNAWGWFSLKRVQKRIFCPKLISARGSVFVRCWFQNSCPLSIFHHYNNGFVPAGYTVPLYDLVEWVSNAPGVKNLQRISNLLENDTIIYALHLLLTCSIYHFNWLLLRISTAATTRVLGRLPLFSIATIV